MIVLLLKKKLLRRDLPKRPGMNRNCGRISKRNIMVGPQLYKYLDFEGGLRMLENSNLQFTNATRLNDPFDCTNDLIDFSNVPAERCKNWPPNIIKELESSYYRNLRKKIWMCSLSKVYDELLMWGYYSSHRGICIGLDIEKVEQYLGHVWCGGPFIGAQKMEVQYKDIFDKPDFFHNMGITDFFNYQLSTKSNAWEHEQEVRLLLVDPAIGLIPPGYSKEDQKEDGSVDSKDVHFYSILGRECFNELYLGVQMNKNKQDEIIDVARSLNPKMKIYRMTVDSDSFRLKPRFIDFD